MLQLDVVLIAFRRKAQSAIKKSVEKAQPFHLAVNFNGAQLEALSLQKFPREMCLGYGNRPAEVGKRDSLGSATLTDLSRTLLDVVPRLGEQPVAQVPEDFFDWSPQFLDRDSPHISGERGGSEFRDQLDRKLVEMTLNRTKLNGDHASLLT
jgi:hypothetical protein